MRYGQPWPRRLTGMGNMYQTAQSDIVISVSALTHIAAVSLWTSHFAESQLLSVT